MNSTPSRIAAAFLSLSFAGGVYILQREGYSGTAIIPTKGDVPTLGFGSTTGVRMGDHTDPVRAIARAATEIDTKYESSVKRCITAPIAQRELDAYVGLAYNIGTGAFCRSTLVKEVNQQHYAEGCKQILAWKMYQSTDCSKPNKVCGGLWADRQKLYSMCTGGAQ